MIIVMSLRAAADDPSGPWWTIGGLCIAAALAAMLSFWALRGDWLYAAGILLNIAACVWWQQEGHRLFPTAWLSALVLANVIVLSVGGLISLLMELSFLRPAGGDISRTRLPFHQCALIVAAAALAFVAAIALFCDIARFGGPPQSLMWPAIAAATALTIARCYDPDAHFILGGFYVLGLVAIATFMHALHLRPWSLVRLTPILVSAYSLLIGSLYVLRANLAQLASSIAIPMRPTWPGPAPNWLARALNVQASIVLLLCLLPALGDRQFTIRMAMALSTCAAAASLALFAWDRPGTRTKIAALILGAAGIVLWSWSWLDPMLPSIVLDRLVLAMVALSAVTAFYGAGLAKLLRRQNDWTLSARILVPYIAGATALTLLAILAIEGVSYDPAGGIIAWWGILCISLALVALIVGARVCAAVSARILSTSPSAAGCSTFTPPRSSSSCSPYTSALRFPGSSAWASSGCTGHSY